MSDKDKASRELALMGASDGLESIGGYEKKQTQLFESVKRAQELRVFCAKHSLDLDEVLVLALEKIKSELPKIELHKKYRLTGFPGRPGVAVVLLTVSAPGEYPVIGYTDDEDGIAMQWTDKGLYVSTGELPNHKDLVISDD